MRHYGVVLCVVALLGLLGAAHADSYTGSLSADDGGLLASGLWAGSAALEWEIMQNADLSWHYSYELQVPAGAVSHVLFEVSDTFTADDIVADSIMVNGAPGSYDTIGEQKAGNGNVGMPSTIWGIKFAGGATTMTYAFDSWRVPVWQDFYAKDGKVGDTWNYVYNAGFSDENPTVAAHDGSEGYHILAPDTHTSHTPEPSVFALALAGLGGAWVRRRRAR